MKFSRKLSSPDLKDSYITFCTKNGLNAAAIGHRNAIFYWASGRFPVMRVKGESQVENPRTLAMIRQVYPQPVSPDNQRPVEMTGHSLVPVINAIGRVIRG